MITVDEMVKSSNCPCEVCSSQDDEQKLLDRQSIKESPLSKQINKNPTTLVRIDTELHRLLKIKAAAEKTTIRALIEGVLAELLSVEGVNR